MRSSILKYFWFVLALASGLVAALLGLSQYGIKIDFTSWARISSEIINGIPVVLNYPMVESYGFYGGVLVFLIFLVLFVIASRASRKSSSESNDSFDTSSDVSAQSRISESDDSPPNPDYLDASLSRTETFDQPAETPSIEADNHSNPDGSSGESVEYASEEEWIETLQKFQGKEAQ